MCDIRSLRFSETSKMDEDKSSWSEAALATRDMTVMTGAASLTVTSHTLPPSTSTLTASCVWERRVLIIACLLIIVQCTNSSSLTLGAHAHSEGYSSCRVCMCVCVYVCVYVCMCVCVCVCDHS